MVREMTFKENDWMVFKENERMDGMVRLDGIQRERTYGWYGTLVTFKKGIIMHVVFCFFQVGSVRDLEESHACMKK